MTSHVALLGHPVSHSLSPRMQNAAFAAAGLDWHYSAFDVEDPVAAVAALRTLGFAGANVTIPHKQAVVAVCDEADGDAVNTLVFRDGRVLGLNTDREILAGIVLDPGLPDRRRRRRADARRRRCRPTRARSAGAASGRPTPTGCDLIVNATPVRDELLVEPRAGQTVVDLAYSHGRRRDRARRGGAGGRLRGDRRARGARPPGRQELRALDGRGGAGRRSCASSRASRLSAMTLRLATAGESHGPALVAILTGLRPGSLLDRDAIDADLKRRQEGYGRSPRQQIEQDRVEVLAGLRHGRTLGTPLALVVRNVDHKNWTWGMSPWPPEGEPQGKGTKAVTLPRPGHADLPGVLKYGLDDVRNALERASARHTAVHVAAGGGREGAARSDRRRGARRRRSTRRRSASGSTRRGRRATRSAGSIEVRVARRAAGARLVRGQGGPARRAPRRCRDGHPGGQGRRDRRRVRARRSSSARRRTTRSAPTAAGRRTAPAASRAASRTARRSSSGRR